MKYTEQQLKEILMENDYPASNPKLIESVVEQLKGLTPEAEAAFYEWCDSRNLPSFDIEGVNAGFLKGTHKMNDIAVILVYDGLIRNPKAAYLFKKPIILHK